MIVDIQISPDNTVSLYAVENSRPTFIVVGPFADEESAREEALTMFMAQTAGEVRLHGFSSGS